MIVWFALRKPRPTNLTPAHLATATHTHPMQARDEAELARGVRLFLRPGALLALGLACYAIGLVASAQAPPSSHDLYIATSGAAFDGDSGLASFWTRHPPSLASRLPRP